VVIGSQHSLNQGFLFEEVGPNLHWPDAWNVGSRLYPLSFCAFDAALNVMSVDHNASVCGGCHGFVVLNDFCLALPLGNSLLGEVGLC
jgi:hypothetical protein